MRKILFIVATHGDEGFSLDVIKSVQANFSKSEYGYNWVIGNQKAYQQNVRFIDCDLNRSAPGDKKSDLYEERRAAELVEYAKDFDIIIDIHGTRTDMGIVKIIPYPTKETLQLANTIPVERNVIWYAKESDVSGPIVQHVGKPALEFECGPMADSAIAKELKVVLEEVLRLNKAGKIAVSDPVGAQDFYAVFGKDSGKIEDGILDFQEITRNGESFFPFLSANQYVDTKYYKMRRITLQEAQEVIL